MEGLNEVPSAAILAISAVVVVPILEPNVSGYTLSTVSTPKPTRGVRALVKTELDCTKNVITAPTNKAR